MKIIIIGNGFDLNLGLKTRYKDFVDSDYFTSLIKSKNTLATYLINKSQLNNWIDIEKEITNYSIEVENLNNGETSINVKDDFKALKMALTDYLKEVQEGKINPNSKAFEMAKNEFETADLIYNFNYTNTVFQVAEILNIEGIKSKHSYVHGSIENSDIIVGVEDGANIYPKHIFLKKAADKNFRNINMDNLIDDNDFIVFGHSMGVTDSSYFKYFIRALTRSRNKSELKFYHYGKIAYDEMMMVINEYSDNSLTRFRGNNNFIAIDSSE